VNSWKERHCPGLSGYRVNQCSSERPGKSADTWPSNSIRSKPGNHSPDQGDWNSKQYFQAQKEATTSRLPVAHRAQKHFPAFRQNAVDMKCAGFPHCPHTYRQCRLHRGASDPKSNSAEATKYFGSLATILSQ
jgi:hypothetical protein